MIKVSYAFKKDSKGERHGDAAERLLAANRPLVSRPQFFGQSAVGGPMNYKSLLLPPSLVSSHYSHMLSNEGPASKPAAGGTASSPRCKDRRRTNRCPAADPNGSVQFSDPEDQLDGSADRPSREPK